MNTIPVPASLADFSVAHIEAQRVEWVPSRWIYAFAGHESAYADLKAHSEEAGGIARSFIHARAQGDPVDMFLMTMAWGYQPKDYGPARTRAVNRPGESGDDVHRVRRCRHTWFQATG